MAGSERGTVVWGEPEKAMAAALHRMNLPECEPDADDYSDEAEHLIVGHDLLASLRAHGWVLVPLASQPSPLDAFATALGNLDRPR